MLDFALSGIDQAVRTVRNIGQAVTDEKIAAEAMQALEPVAETARQLAPVRSGELRDNIVVSDMLRDGPERKGKAVYVGVLAGKALHAGFVELGTLHMQAQPFLTPAFEQHRDLIINILGKGAGRLILSAN